jgi:hypothetical protein
VAYCTARGSHALASEIHTQERVILAPARGGRNGTLSSLPGSWSTGDAGGGPRFGWRLMERSRSGFEIVDLKASIDPASGVLEEMIHDGEEAGKGGWCSC